MFPHHKTERSDFDPPPCRKCGCDENPTRHHIYPRRFEFGERIANRIVILCRDCHDKLERIIRQREKHHGQDRNRSQLPMYNYPHIVLSFIT